MTTRPSLDLVRASYREIALYAPDRTPVAVDLSDNTNLWGVPPAAARAVNEAVTSAYTRYPALYAGELKRALADYCGVASEEIVTGCGSDDILDSAIRAFAEPGDRIAFADPTFAMLPLFAKMNALDGIAVPLTDTYDIDPGTLLAAEPRIIYLCSPNNPTGTVLSTESIERVITAAPGVVILDEAYAEFMGGGWADRAPRYDNLLVVRTLSKAFGLAGLRIGYATGNRALVGEVEKSRGPYKVSALAERAACAALRDDRAWILEHVADARAMRDRLTGELRAMGFVPLPSRANFVLMPIPDAGAVAQRMRAAGVAVRPFTGLHGIGDALRITVGPWPMMQDALRALADAR